MVDPAGVAGPAGEVDPLEGFGERTGHVPLVAGSEAGNWLPSTRSTR
jgi:hypothetical protein